MSETPIMIASWPRAIMHLDADAFFASCEQALHPELRGRPVITGKERGIVILRRFSPAVEEYSIDEAFVDLTGLRRLYQGSYGDIWRKIQATIDQELGLSVSVGISLTKVLAKIASKYQKPHGLTEIPGNEIHRFLKEIPIEKVWGIGPNTSALLKKKRIVTALDFAQRPEPELRRFLSKPYLEIWQELNGQSVYPVDDAQKPPQQSISKTRTFTPPSRDREFVFGQMAKNLENACIKARRHGLIAGRISVFLKHQDFHFDGWEAKINRPTAYPAELLGPVKEMYDRIFSEEGLYRATGIVLADLSTDQTVQVSLFEDPVRIEKLSRLYKAIDTLSARFGKHTIHHGASQPAEIQNQHEGERGDIPERKKELLTGETKRQRLGIPFWDAKI